jgi:hypothetical protein
MRKEIELYWRKVIKTIFVDKIIETQSFVDGEST